MTKLVIVSLFFVVCAMNACTNAFQANYEDNFSLDGISEINEQIDGPVIIPKNPESESAETRVSKLNCEPSVLSSANNSKEYQVNINLLTSTQYNNTIRDLMNINVDAQFEERPSEEGFNNLAEKSLVDIIHLKKQLDIAEEVAVKMVADQDLKNKYLKCENNTNENDCIKDIIQKLGTKLFRKPITSEELNRIYKYTIMPHNSNFNQKARAAIQLILISPQFTYQIVSSTGNGVSNLNEFELASRLSYFIWNTAPDQTLNDLAKSNQLKNNLDQQVDRMLKDNKSIEMAKDLSLYWFNNKKINTKSADKSLLNKKQTDLDQSKISESIFVLNDIIKEDLDIETILKSDFTYVNRQLSSIYDISASDKDNLVKVNNITDEKRKFGLLSHASFLSSVSTSANTHIIKRGHWILENLLCDAPAGPPSGAIIQEEEVLDPDASPQDLVELHKNEGSSCFNCHKVMDPVGVALENYDSFGRWRRKYTTGHIVRTISSLEDGSVINDLEDMSNYLTGVRKADFNYCTTKKLLQYSLGRVNENSNARQCMIYAASKNATNESGNVTMGGLIKSIVTSPLFLKYSSPDN